ncbi:hypothetical protein GUITHDRAFT_143556 [Guillardia theta CCMP2712]|uniref:Uncharacterized protein n=1 Tax=Guillardia theta (strain CCMP2712) TaxID=905079 RepID=L1IU50_GUITC|nr:hypothetical protein GUITHDRAFT_143556 [Guillardia theta CCMP2712]EKX39355.1 hypothetical protein GUITHDRAFT_143556 [Guillardia theta CCMP2712]|eukprot:XP_005826335.1 hypothetical protein GUITHDRAFT_143556 [Guillardia theta CCMP2712]
MSCSVRSAKLVRFNFNGAAYFNSFSKFYRINSSSSSVTTELTNACPTQPVWRANIIVATATCGSIHTILRQLLVNGGSSVLPDVHDLFLRVGTRTLQQVERHLALYLIALQKSPNQKQLNLNDMYAALGMSGSWLDHQIRAQLAKTSPSAQAPKSQSVNNLIDLQSVLQLQHQQQSLQSNPAAAIALLPALQGALAGQLQQLKQQIQQQQQLQQILQLQQQLEQIQQLQSAQSQAKPTPPSSQTKSKTPAAPGQQKVATSSAMSILHLTSQNQPSKTTAGSNLSKSTTSAASAISSHPLGQASKGLSSFQQQSQQKVPGSSQHIKYPIPSQHPSASGGGQDKKLQNALGMKHTAAGIVIDDSQSFSDQFKKRGRDESLVLTDDGLLTSAAFMQRSKVGNEKNAKKPKSRDSPSQHSPVLATAPKLWANIKSEHDVQAANKNPMSMDFLLDGSCNANVKNSNGSKKQVFFAFFSDPIQRNSSFQEELRVCDGQG